MSEVTLDTNLPPWPTRDDLISMKALSASERFYKEKTRKDVGDIEALLKLQPGPLLFTGCTMAEAKKAMVEELVPKAPSRPSSAAGRKRSGSRVSGYKPTMHDVSRRGMVEQKTSGKRVDW